MECQPRCQKASKKGQEEEEVAIFVKEEEEGQVVEEIGRVHGEDGTGTIWIEGRSR